MTFQTVSLTKRIYNVNLEKGKKKSNKKMKKLVLAFIEEVILVVYDISIIRNGIFYHNNIICLLNYFSYLI